MIRKLTILLALMLLCICNSGAQETQRVYLSGHGKDDAVPWRFMCTTGALSGFWTNLPVPSNWDVKGFGHLTYKKDYSNSITECGLYEKDFTAPKKWKDKRVFLVFEGAMTDTSAKLNGQSVGPTHQGGFYRFKYEVTDKLKLGAENKLEVTVAKHSANESVNRAERLADYWVFGGIYRPVYLEVVPQQFIERVAIDARADGSFAMEVFLNGVIPQSGTDSVEAQIVTTGGKKVGEVFSRKPLTPALSPSEGERVAGRPGEGNSARLCQLQTQVVSPKLWTAETPNLYRVEVRLKRGKQVLHEFTQRFGFRTFEVRDGDGLYLNGQKIILKGVNRHSAWPDSGRCLSEAVHRLDITTIKEMNGNAVRMSHYPPDAEFLDLCDELGLYVLNELAGWHNSYDTKVGTKLVEEMVTRDVNHPSILFWDNGNEGGSNPELDRVFHKFDPQQRRVLHPWGLHSGLNTAHYLAYTNAEVAARGEPMYYHPKEQQELLNTNLPSGWIYMPTEFMHGLYDGGAGAGLEDYWNMMMSYSNCAGGFIWVFADEGIKNPHTGQLDTAGNQAPDGIVGPYREREGSFYAIKELWSPIQVSRNYVIEFTMENHDDFTDASQFKFTWQLKRFESPLEKGSTSQILKEVTVSLPAIPPGGKANLYRPESFSSIGRIDTDIIALSVNHPRGERLWTWTWPLGNIPPAAFVGGAVSSPITVEDEETFQLNSPDVTVEISKKTGFLSGVWKDGKRFSLSRGPRTADGGNLVLNVETLSEELREKVFAGEIRYKSVNWTLFKNGWLQCDFTYTATGTQDVFGVMFDYPEHLVKKKRWLGDGPFRVWKNRLRGVTFGEWENDYNNTITGYSGWKYPEFKGCFSNVRWLQLETTEGLITVVPENIPFVQVLTPEQPPDNLIGKTKVNLPQCGLGFLHAIPPIGTKFKPAAASGPQSQPNVGQGEYSGRVSFYFGKLP